MIRKIIYSFINYLFINFVYFVSSFKLLTTPFFIDKGLSFYLKSGVLHLSSFRARRYFYIYLDGGELTISSGVFFNQNCSINCQRKIYIGRNSLFGENVKIYDHDHVFSSSRGVSKNEFITSDVNIGENCWIGSNTVILKGVNICNNVLIGANSIVNKDIKEPGKYIWNGKVLVKIHDKRSSCPVI